MIGFTKLGVSTKSASVTRWRWLMAVLGMVLAMMLLYGSLIPLQYRPLDWTETLDRWRSIPWLKLGVYNRADWIANGLLVVPIAFLLTGAFVYRGFPGRVLNWLSDLLLASVVIVFLFSMVFGIELLQVWFPPRTVSRNDIISGWIGAVIGASLWLICGRPLIGFLEWFLELPRFEDRLFAFSLLACIAGILYSIYPLDFVLSSAEWAEKIRLGRVKWWGGTASVFKLEWFQGLIVSSLRMVPFGILGAFIKSLRLRCFWIVSMAVLLELIQLPVFSKFSSIEEMVAGCFGGGLGLLAAQPNGLTRFLVRTRWVWCCGAATWSGLLIAAFLWRFDRWVSDPAELQLRWSGFLTYPFLRYYYTSEYSALTNLLGKLLSFGVLGVCIAGAVMFGSRSIYKPYRDSFRWAWWISIPLGLIIEILQVYMPPLIGDLCDVFIYSMGASLGAWLAVFQVEGLAKPHGVAARLPVDRQVVKTMIDSPERLRVLWISKGMGCVSLFLGVLLASFHPGWPGFQIVATLVLFAVVFRFPWFFPTVFILSLIGGDAYPITGQLVVQEYDSLLFGEWAGLFLSLSKARWMGGGSEVFRKHPEHLSSDWLLLIGLGVLSLSTLVSLVVGMIRLPSAPWGDQLSVYFTQWNALRISKGVFWGVGFGITSLVVGIRSIRLRQEWGLAFLRGCSLAGAYVGVFVIIERVLFPGLLNWTDVYRATGPFFTMHIGDQHIDAFLVLVFPWVWTNLMYSQIRVLERWFCAVVLGLMAYVALSTMSRATLAVLCLQIVLLIALSCQGALRQTGGKYKGVLAVGLGVVLLIGVYLGIQSRAIQGRFSTLAQDWSSRVEHWRMILDRGATGFGGISIGHGIGTLPSLVAADFGRPVPPLSWNQVLEGESSRGEIRFIGTWPIYLERYVGNASEKTLDRLQLESKRIRTEEFVSQGTLSVQPLLVEKSMLESFSSRKLPAYDAVDTWHRLDLTAMKVREDIPVSRSELLTRWRPWTFGLSVVGEGAIVIRSDGEGGVEGVGDRSSYPWFFTCDDHMVWRAKNFLVHAFYEQGIVGVAGWLMLLLGGVWQGCRKRSVLGLSQVVSVLGFIGVGFFGTLIDTPWITALLLGSLTVRLNETD